MKRKFFLTAMILLVIVISAFAGLITNDAQAIRIGLDIEPSDNLVFTTVPEGYVPEEKTLTITNVGAGCNIRWNFPSQFQVSAYYKQAGSEIEMPWSFSNNGLERGDQAILKVRPKAGLSQGIYHGTGTIRIVDKAYDFGHPDSLDYDFGVTFTVDNSVPQPPQQHEVKFMDGDTVIDSVFVNHGETVQRPGEPYKDAAVFIDWFVDKTSTTEFDFENTTITGPTLIYAKFFEGLCKITWDLNGGALINPRIELVDNIGVNVVLTKSGLESMVLGMISPPDDKEFDYLEINGRKWTEDTYTVTNHTTIKIIWRDILPEFTTQPIGGNIDSGDDFTITWEFNKDEALFVLEKWDATLNEWVIEDFEIESPYTIPAQTTSTSITKLYRVVANIDGELYMSDQFLVTWDRVFALYPLTIDYNGGTKQDELVVEGSVYEETILSAVEWFANFSNFVTPPEGKVLDYVELNNSLWTSPHTVTGPVNIKLFWRDKIAYTVNFKDGETILETVDVNEGEQVARPLEDPTKDNYIFVDWYTDETLETLHDFSEEIYADTDIYAKFTLNENSATNTDDEDDNNDEGEDINLPITGNTTDENTANTVTNIANTTADTNKTNNEVGNTSSKTIKDTKNSPNTGDNIIFYIVALVISAIGIIAGVIYTKGKKNTTENK